MSEGQVVKACINWLFAHGCYVWRNNTGAYRASYTRKDGKQEQYHVRYGLNGSADILGLTRSGRFISVECKYGSNGLQESQQRFGERVKEKNGLYIVAYGIDDLEKHKAEITA